MGIFGTLLRTAIHTVTVPVDIVKDVATVGGVLTDEESYTVRKAKKIGKDLGDVGRAVDKLGGEG